VVPEEYAGDVLGDLAGRRANINGVEARGDGLSSIEVEAPLGEMFGYATNLRNISQGRGSFTMEFEKYVPVPASLMEAIIRGGH